MGFLSSLFGGGSKQPITTTNVVSSKLPPEIAPYVKQILTEGQQHLKLKKQQVINLIQVILLLN
tara:strand:- start:1173 stop:1364 length:192 start_codon:yes stop_codon:yes gene_type:complete